MTEIMRVMVKFGFGEVFDRLGFGDVLARARRLVGLVVGDHQLSRPKRLRLALEELGLVFVKLGQYLSTRQDLLPAEYLEELTLLQDSLPPIPPERVARIINEELDEGVLESLSPEPLAAASIGQVHEARLRDGGVEVVVKVRRPGLQKQIATDLEILAEVAALAARHLPIGDYVHPKELVDEFAKNLNTELNFRLEAVNIERFGRLYAKSPSVKIPTIFKALCTANVLVMEKISGWRIDQPEALRAAGLDPAEVARVASRVALEQIITVGLFHADPHPGNILVQPGPRLAFMDFGLVGSLDRRVRDNLLSMARGVVARDPARVVRAILKVTTCDGPPDREALEREIGVFIETHLSGSLKDLILGDLLKDVLEVMSQHRLRAPQSLFLLVKALVQFESLGLRLDPDFDIVSEAEPVVAAIYRERLSPGYWLEAAGDRSLEALGLVENLPGDLSAIWKTIKTGRLPADLTIREIDRLSLAVNQASYRLSFAIVLAALVVGSSVVVHSKIPPLLYGLPVLGLAGFLGAAVVGFWLIWDFLRKNKEF
jgi:ubiquinone biosynthesis protein